MKPQELENLSREELFEVLKGKCKSKSRVNFYVGLALLFFMIVSLIFVETQEENKDGMDHIILLIGGALIFCAAGWLVMNNYRFLKRAVNLDTPDQLLYWYDKKIRYDRITNYLVMLACLCPIWRGANPTLLTGLIILVAFIVFSIIMYKTVEPIVSNRDQEIIRQLQKLVDKK